MAEPSYKRSKNAKGNASKAFPSRFQFLERKPQPKLNEPWIAKRAAHAPEVAGRPSRIRGGKLRVVEDVEELRPELEVHAFPRPEGRPLEHREVEVLNTILPEMRIDPRLVSETKGRRSSKAGRVEPLVQPRAPASGSGRVASGCDVRP